MILTARTKEWGDAEVGDEDIPIDPILIDEDETETETNDNSLEHVPKEEDEPEEKDDTTVESVDDEEEEQQQEKVPLASASRPRASENGTKTWMEYTGETVWLDL